MQILKADTETKVRMGPFVDVGDGFVPETGVTLAGGGDNADEAELLKAAGAATVDISGNTWAAIANCDGWYDLTLTAGNLDTEGVLTVVVQNDSVHLPVHKEFMVVNANVFDSLYGTAAADYLKVDTLQINGTAQTAGDVIAATITNAQGADVATDVAAAIGTDNKCLISTDAQDLSGTLDVNTKTITAGAVNAAAIANAAIDNATFAADVGSTAYATNIIALAVRKVLDELNLDHLMKVAVANRATLAEVVDDTVLANIMTKTDGDTSDFDQSTDSLEAIRDKQTDIETDTNAVDVLTKAAGAGDLAAILADTGTDGVKLANDAITSAKYDESTAYPVSSGMKMAGGTIVEGTVSWDNTNATTTVFYSDDITEATADHYIGRVVIFTSGALLYQATDITDYALVAGEGKFTVTALTEAPADNVTFVIV